MPLNQLLIGSSFTQFKFSKKTSIIVTSPFNPAPSALFRYKWKGKKRVFKITLGTKSVLCGKSILYSPFCVCVYFLSPYRLLVTKQTINVMPEFMSAMVFCRYISVSRTFVSTSPDTKSEGKRFFIQLYRLIIIFDCLVTVS